MQELAGVQAVGTPLLLRSLQQFEEADRTGNVDRVRATLADDARVETVASGRRTLGPDETVEALRTAVACDPYYLAGPWTYEELAPDLILTTTPVRQTSSAGGISHRTFYRITGGREGRIWRQKIFASRAEALAYLERHGRGLGL
jgi:hypothetical protein